MNKEMLGKETFTKELIERNKYFDKMVKIYEKLKVCNERMCQKELELYNTKVTKMSKTDIKKFDSKINQIKKSKEHINLLTCQFNNCREKILLQLQHDSEFRSKFRVSNNLFLIAEKLIKKEKEGKKITLKEYIDYVNSF
jgi:hypothetical protein